MQKTQVERPEIKIVGTMVRTRNSAEFDPLTAKIGPCVQQYFHNTLADQIPNRKNPGTTFSIFTEYESDYTGEYDYFIGEEVTDFGDLDGIFQTHIIPAQSYILFTNGPAPMPEVVITAWQEIWQMSDEDMGGKRAYLSDFEVYDERASDPQDTTVDIYIGVK